MSQQFRQSPASLVSLSDPYAAFCFNEAIYMFGNFVEAELRRVSDKAKDGKDAQRKRQEMLALLLRQDEEPMTLTSEKKFTNVPHNVATLDADDPVSAETAARMPPAVKFSGRKFKDPAELFDKEPTRLSGKK